jgi:hypothetical protein
VGYSQFFNFDLKKEGRIMKVNLTIGIPVWLDRICAWPFQVYRRHKYGYPYRRIYLGEGKFAIVDPPDYYWLNNFHWCLKQNGPRIYAVRLISGSSNRTKILSLHREIMNAPPGLLVDHGNGDTLDNRRANLRLATHSQNSCNTRRNKTKALSRFRGVTLSKRDSRWVARIRYERKLIWLGRFDNEIEAAKAYDEAAKKYHGEYACLNFRE